MGVKFDRQGDEGNNSFFDDLITGMFNVPSWLLLSITFSVFSASVFRFFKYVSMYVWFLLSFGHTLLLDLTFFFVFCFNLFFLSTCN